MLRLKLRLKAVAQEGGCATAARACAPRAARGIARRARARLGSNSARHASAAMREGDAPRGIFRKLG